MKRFFTEKKFNLLDVILIITFGQLLNYGVYYAKDAASVIRHSAIFSVG